MPLRSLGLRATTLAAATLAAAALAAVPAVADQPPADPAAQSQQADRAPQTPQDQQAQQATQNQQAQQPPEDQQATQNQTAQQGRYKGRVVARGGLYLRDKPTRGSRVVGLAKYGTVVHIFCKTRGDSVDGNNRWYLLTDGTWAWGSARYIDNIGAVPRWC
ncbi:SH3 domain-containing protein [Streptomyces sp. NPDC047002]|uniref:SH3 domain-containing protein n=1 Tax=Streptomyces sp. NPDC047002 TaxID=3155475 RepID=UPI003451B617